jgi:hypothetical protein
MDPDGGVTGESWQWARTTTPATLAYTLGGTDAASFDIGSATGQLMTLAPLDYETKATYSVTVTASDSGGLSDSIDVTITVMMDSWMDIAGETNAAYTVTEGDTGYYLRVMATYTDAVGTDTAMEYSMPTMMVTAVGEMMGEVTLWAGTDALTMAPQVGETITGAVMDPDGGVTGETWQWSRTMDTADMSSWMPITGATDAAYMVTAGDEGYYLRVMATYTDAVGTATAMEYSMSTMMVTAVGRTRTRRARTWPWSTRRRP